MLANALGMDLSTPSGLWSFAVFTTLACLGVGFFTDTILGKVGFGVFGNGCIVIIGVVLTVYALDRRIGGFTIVDTMNALALAAACGIALLLSAAALKQRVG